MPDIVNKLTSIGIDLTASGVSEFALTREQALNVLKKAHELELTVLGGDVFKRPLGSLVLPKHCYDSWSFSISSNESSSLSKARSIREAVTYLNSYPSDPQNEIFFTLVFA